MSGWKLVWAVSQNIKKVKSKKCRVSSFFSTLLSSKTSFSLFVCLFRSGQFVLVPSSLEEFFPVKQRQMPRQTSSGKVCCCSLLSWVSAGRCWGCLMISPCWLTPTATGLEPRWGGGSGWTSVPLDAVFHQCFWLAETWYCGAVLTLCFILLLHYTSEAGIVLYSTVIIWQA